MFLIGARRSPRPLIRMLAAAAVPAVALLTAIAAPGSAAAVPGGILVSTDGVTWHSGSIAGPLPAVGPLVPGGSGTWILHARNTSALSATLMLAVQVEVGSADLLDHLDLHATAAGGVGELVTPTLGECQAILTGPVLAAGETVVVDIGVAMDAAAPNAAQGVTAQSTVYATLVEDAGGALPPAACPRDESGPLSPSRPDAIARTGVDARAGAPIAASAALLAIVGLLVVARGHILSRRPPRAGR